jgi:hypothetical protein
MPVRFDRSLDDRFLAHLKTNLAWLVSAPRRQPIQWALDPQFRERAGRGGATQRPGNTFALYYGTTELLHAKWSSGDVGDFVSFSARGSHLASDAAGLLGRHALGTAAGLETKAQRYLSSAMAAGENRYFTPDREGYWQNFLAWWFGSQWNPQKELLVVDRETVLGFDSADEKDAWYGEITRSYERLAERIRASRTDKFQKPANFGDELDLLAIDRQGRLICMELKHRDYSSGVYWAPLQVSAYRDAYAKASAALHAGIAKVVRQKIELGLLPTGAEHVLPKRPWTGEEICPVVAIAQPSKESSGWDAWKALRIVQLALAQPVPVMLVDAQSDGIEASWHQEWPLPSPA